MIACSLALSHYPRPDNVGAVARVEASVSKCPSVMQTVVFCMFHQTHLIAKDVLVTFDAWVWKDDVWPTSYFTGVASVVHQWRHCGNHTKINNACSSIFDVATAMDTTSKMPGRALKYRWGAVSALEASIIKAMGVLHRVYEALWGHVLDAAVRARRPLNPGAAEDIAYQEERRTITTNSVKLLGKKLFNATICISYVAKADIMHFQNWSQKAIKTWRRILISSITSATM